MTLANVPGTLVWNEVMTSDPSWARQFYADVFGVTFTDLGGADFDYLTMEVQGATVGGLGRSGPESSPYWMTYFAVDGTDLAVEQVLALGGSHLSEPTDSPFGRMAVVADPHGAYFAVITPPSL